MTLLAPERWVPKLLRRCFIGKDTKFMFNSCTMPGSGEITATGLYLHIPFCHNLCPYCPYNKIPYDASLVSPYRDAMLREIDLYAERYGRMEVTSIYIGGGTPTLLVNELATILARLRERFRITGDICIETGPRDLTDRTIAALRAMDVKLISVGVQSFQDKQLAFIGRNYRAAELPGQIGRLLAAGFSSVNLDFMFALPGQTTALLRADLDAAIRLGVNQITAYPLFTFPYSQVGRYLRLKNVTMPSLRTRKKLYYFLYDYLLEHGFHRVSVWGFKRGAAPRYSSVTRDRYLGFGAGAGSHLSDGFYLNTFSVPDYISHCQEQQFPTALHMPFTQLMQDYFWLYWRLYDTRIPKRELYSRLPAEARKLNRVLQAAQWVGMIDGSSDLLELRRRGAFWIHLLQNYLSLSYINRIWQVAMQQPYPSGIEL